MPYTQTGVSLCLRSAVIVRVELTRVDNSGTFHIAEVTSRFVSTEAFTDQVESFGFELVSESSPSTHFTLFEFTKIADVPVGPVKGEKGWEKRVAEGGQILRPCVYKKR